MLASVVGEEGLAETDRSYLAFGDAFEHDLVSQAGPRTLEQSMDAGWRLLAGLPQHRARAPVRRADRGAPEAGPDSDHAIAPTPRRSRHRDAVSTPAMDITPTRSVVLELKDERRAMHEGYVFLDEKCLLLAGEMLRELARYAELQRAFVAAWDAAVAALQAAVARHGLEGLQVYPPRGSRRRRGAGARRAR